MKEVEVLPYVLLPDDQPFKNTGEQPDAVIGEDGCLGEDNPLAGRVRQIPLIPERVVLERRLVPNTPLIEGSRDYPSQFLIYEYFTYVPLDREPAESRIDFVENPVAVLYRWMSNTEYAQSYLIITRSQKVSTDTLGALPPGSLENIQQQLMNSDAFEVVFSNQDAIVFTIRPRE